MKTRNCETSVQQRTWLHLLSWLQISLMHIITQYFINAIIYRIIYLDIIERCNSYVYQRKNPPACKQINAATGNIYTQ